MKLIKKNSPNKPTKNNGPTKNESESSPYKKLSTTSKGESRKSESQKHLMKSFYIGGNNGVSMYVVFLC